MPQPQTKRNLQRIIPFGVIWLLSGWVFLFVEFASFQSVQELPDTAIKMDYKIFLLSSLAMWSIGLLNGLIEIKYLSPIFINKKFARRFFPKLFIYLAFFLIVILVTYPIATSLEMNTSIMDGKVWQKFLNYFFSIIHISTILQLAVAVILSLFYLEVGGFIGHRALRNFFTGKYHTPIEEERIFMFLDMKSSTSIAEKLGHIQYFRLLRAYYKDFTEAIIKHSGEVYQYVGDEIVISWKFRDGIRDNNCVACFFQMRHDLLKKSSWYLENFEVIPTFKAAIHFGSVTTGEIGALKKQIIFTGDVLNTTARIQHLCNDYNVDILISKVLQEELLPVPEYKLIPLGNRLLEGKKEEIALYTINYNPI